MAGLLNRTTRLFLALIASIVFNKVTITTLLFATLFKSFLQQDILWALFIMILDTILMRSIGAFIEDDYSVLIPNFNCHESILSSGGPASTAVLETYELLEGILSATPLSARQINKFKRVSKNWNNVVKTSKRIVEMYILSPVPGDSPISLANIARAKTPFYNTSCRISIHKIFRSKKDIHHTSRQSLPEGVPRCHRQAVLRFDYLERCHPRVLKNLDAFATMPPCKEMKIEFIPDRKSNVKVEKLTLRMDEGIRIKDILYAADDIQARYGGMAQAARSRAFLRCSFDYGSVSKAKTHCKQDTAQSWLLLVIVVVWIMSLRWRFVLGMLVLMTGCILKQAWYERNI